MKVAIVGANGLLGSATVQEWREAGHDVQSLTRADLDLTDHVRLNEVMSALAPALVINCTAYNRVDDAETAPSEALAVNTWAVRSLARAATRIGATFVHYSTDFVFDGMTDRPYTEDDVPNPLSNYGASKLMGEWFALDVGAPHYVLRVESLFGGAANRSSIDTMLATMRAGRPVTAFEDRTVSPSYVPDVTAATRRLVELSASSGVYHCVNAGHVTWLELARHLAELSRCPDADIRGVPAASVALKAKRPQFAALSNARLRALGVVMPTWQDALRRHLA
jgi:dTDP-4-dehydrorhamnose reductase